MGKNVLNILCVENLGIECVDGSKGKSIRKKHFGKKFGQHLKNGQNAKYGLIE